MSDSQEAIQLIDEKKEFNSKTLKYFEDCLGDRAIGVDYHVISVFGSQSSGKSTLLNKLFSTKFDTMDAQVKRQQTTKGIWLSHSRCIYSSEEQPQEDWDYFVLDVEGSDGAERGEDQDFERKAALFALSVSEILIINMWENQVGLYQGNNMGLLKTVFEVNLSLFGNSQNSHKVTLLFVIRDFTGQTPLESLKDSLINELDSMWTQLNKPEGCEKSKFGDYFTPKFVALGHKYFQPEKFDADVKKLGTLLVDKTNTVFQEECRTNLPLDGWSLYAENCWEQIENNRDLDLPTQQILVARFKTDEIALAAYSKFIDAYEENIRDDLNGKELAENFKTLKEICVTTDYDPHASRYATAVYEGRRKELLQNIDSKFKVTLEKFIKGLSDSLLQEFITAARNRMTKVSFSEKLNSAHDAASLNFKDSITPFRELGLEYSLDTEITNFEKSLELEAANLKERELELIVARFNKHLSTKLRDSILQILNKPTKDVWDNVFQKFNETLDSTLTKYVVAEGEHDFKVGATEEQNKATAQTMTVNAWSFLDTTIKSHLTEENVVDILRAFFSDKFRYSDDGMPRFWRNETEVDQAYRLAHAESLELLDALSIIKTKDNVEILPPVPLSDEGEYEDEDEDELYHSDRFSHVLNDLQKEKIVFKFRHHTDLAVIEAKRSIVTTTERIPPYMYALVLALGWGKLMAIIQNPLAIVLLIFVLAWVYVIHKLNLWVPLVQFAQTATGQATISLKEMVKNMVIDEGEGKRAVPVEFGDEKKASIKFSDEQPSS